MDAAPLDLLKLLRNSEYAELDRYLSDLQGQFEKGLASEKELLDAFHRFQNSDPTLGEKINEWLQAQEGSYVAHVALANWFLGRAWDARGRQTSNLVSDRGWRGMHYFVEQAEACARHAMTLCVNPLAAWEVVGYAWNTRGCKVSAAEVQQEKYPDWFTQAVQDNPMSFAIRRVMLLHLRTEWGGSEEQMLTFMRQQQDAGLLPQGDMQKLWAAFHSLVSHYHWAFSNDYDQAVERASAAADLHELQSEQLLVALTGAKRSVSDRKAALERFLTAAERDDRAEPVGNFYWALYQSGDFLEPLLPRVSALLQRAAGAGNPEAAIGLGRLQMFNRKWDVPSALPFLRRARDEGNREAAETIVHLQEVNLGVKAALSNSPEKRSDIFKAAELGSDEMSWRVYRDFSAYRTQFDLDDRAKYRYLLRAADAGNNDARFELAQQLRGGFVEVGDDGVLRPVDTPPLQESLDYAKHLLERASAEDHKGAAKALKNAKESAWDAKQASRLKVSAARPENAAAPTQSIPWWRWVLWIWLGSVLIRGCAHLVGAN